MSIPDVHAVITRPSNTAVQCYSPRRQIVNYVIISTCTYVEPAAQLGIPHTQGVKSALLWLRQGLLHHYLTPPVYTIVKKLKRTRGGEEGKVLLDEEFQSICEMLKLW
jgi:hypothetical protein